MSERFDKAPVPETERPYFRKLVLGHDPQKIDFDQMAAAAVLRMGKLISDQTEVTAATSPDSPDVTDTTVAVIEGVSALAQRNSEAGRINTQDTNTYTNDPKSEDPATFVMAQALRGRFDDKLGGAKSEERKRQIEFVNWVRSRENRRKKADTPVFGLPEDYAVLTDIWYGLKHQAKLPEELAQLLQKQAQVLEDLYDRRRQEAVRTGDATQTLSAKYAKEIEANRQFLEQQKAEIRKRILVADEENGEIKPDSRRFRLHTTPDGIAVAVIDVRETGTDQGAPAVVREIARNYAQIDRLDCIVVVNDESAGTKMTILPSERSLHLPHFAQDITAAVAERMNLTEAQYGKGFMVASQPGYGGHEGVVSTPYEGSGISAEQLEEAVMDYLDAPRITQEEALRMGQDLLRRAGGNPFQVTAFLDSPESAWKAGTRKIRLTIPGDETDSQMLVVLDETELELYLQALSTDTTSEAVKQNRHILREKTPFHDAKEVATIRLERAKSALEQVVGRGDVYGMLRIMEGLSLADFRQIDTSLLTRAYHLFANSPEAIAMVYDNPESRWSIRDPRSPDTTADKTSPAYKKALFRFHSIQRMFDYEIPDRLQELAATGRFSDEQQRVALQQIIGNDLVFVATAEGYRFGAGPERNDLHLRNVLEYVTDTRIDASVRENVARQLAAGFGTDMIAAWNELAATRDPVLLSALAMHDTVFEDVFAALEPENRPTEIPGIAGSLVQAPDVEGTRNQLQSRERANGTEAPILTVLVQIGSRDVKEILNNKGIRTFTVSDGGALQFELVRQEFDGFEGAITTPLLEQGGTKRDEVQLARAILQMIRQLEPVLQENPDVKLRIVRGNFTVKTSGQLGYLIGKHMNDSPVLKQILWCDFNNGVYEDGMVDDEDLL